MSIMIADIYEALVEAGTSEEKRRLWLASCLPLTIYLFDVCNGPAPCVVGDTSYKVNIR